MKLPTRLFKTTLVVRGCNDFFNMVYITDYTEKGYTVPSEFRNHFDLSRFGITEPTKIMDSN